MLSVDSTRKLKSNGHSIVAPFWAIDKHTTDHSDLLSINATIIALKTKQTTKKKPDNVDLPRTCFLNLQK